jgi:hypothetical protein
LNGALKYSPTCNKVNKTANDKVNTKAFLAETKSPSIIEKCAQVIDKPESNKIAVFNIGTPQGLKTTTLTGGQTEPKNIEGDKLE